jgi:chromosome segregation ATPase
MSYTQYPSGNSESENKFENRSADNKNNRNKIIFGLLIAALVGSWAYIIYERNKTKEEKLLFVDRIQKDSIDRVALQLQFDMLSTKADSLTTNNQELQGSLAERTSEINKLKASISSILKKKNATAEELAKAQKQIAELNSKIEELFAEVETLKAQNKQLTASNEQLNEEKKKLNEEKDALNSDLDKTKKEKAHVEDVASTLHASNVNITAINLRG